MRTASAKPENLSVLSKVCLAFIFFVSFGSLILSAGAFGRDAGEWVLLAEKACIPKGNYTVEVTTEFYQISPPGRPETGKRTLQGKKTAQLSYTKERGLRVRPPGGTPSFTIDIASMLQKMKGKAEWVIGSKEDILDGDACVIVSSSGEKWLVRLWIRHNDGAVLRYDQYLNGNHISSSKLKYDKKHKGVCLPTRIRTEFLMTGQIMFQRYANYNLR